MTEQELIILVDEMKKIKLNFADLLEIARIDHGNNCLTDEVLVKRLVDEKIALTVCPLSNTALRVVDDLKQHPIKKMLDLGIKATVNSDDPAYFGGYITKNYTEIIEALSLSLEEVKTLVSNSFEYSFLDEETKKKYLQLVHEN